MGIAFVQVRYSDYDPMGHAGRMEDAVGGSNDLKYFYDRAGRLIEVRETGAAGRRLKLFTYASGNAAGNFKNGKLESAQRSNVGSSRCTHAACTGAARSERLVGRGYTNGFLSIVPGYAPNITYHSNGMGPSSGPRQWRDRHSSHRRLVRP